MRVEPEKTYTMDKQLRIPMRGYELIQEEANPCGTRVTNPHAGL